MPTNATARRIGLLAIIALCAAPLVAAEDGELTFPTVEELDKLPTGIKVVHEPDVVLATLSGKNTRRGKYTWWYKTTVTATDADVTIEQFGAFVQVDGKWVNGGSFTGKPYNAEQFAEWYSCDKANIRKGKSAADPKNWSTSDELAAAKMRWYFIGVDATGRRVKGEATVEIKAEIDPKHSKDAEPKDGE
ncbi:MAG: hypothetical protein WD875_06010 [Pirellulales bacterium]